MRLPKEEVASGAEEKTLAAPQFCLHLRAELKAVAPCLRLVLHRPGPWTGLWPAVFLSRAAVAVSEKPHQDFPVRATPSSSY